MILTLKTVSETLDSTWGAILDSEDVPFCVTLEPPWKFNKPNVSCIPRHSVYRCKRIQLPNGDETFEVTGVPDRTGIRFEWGNWVVDTRGCILVGEMYEPLLGEPAIQLSKRAFNQFMQRLEGYDEFKLKVE